MSIYCLQPQQVVRMNETLTKQPNLLIDKGKLESALARPLHGLSDGTYLYPTIVGRGAALLEGIAQAHAFVDGNKRTAWMSSVIYLDLNGVQLRDMNPDETAPFVEGLIIGQYDLEGATVWLNERIVVD